MFATQTVFRASGAMRLRLLSAIILALAIISPVSSTSAATSELNATIADGVSLLRNNRNIEAADRLKHAVDIAPNSAEAHHNLGLALAKLGDTEGAIGELQRATQLKPEADASWLTLGGLQQSSGKIDDAISTYNRFLQLFEGRRADLNDTISKVHKLLDALTLESTRIRTYQAGTEAMRPRAMIQPPAQTLSNDDYVSEATRNGIVRWPATRMPIRVCIHQPDQKRDPVYCVQWREILMRSFQDWSSASNGRVSFKFVSEDASDGISCYFVSKADATADGVSNEAEAGEAKMFVDPEGIKGGTIKLLTRSMSPVLPMTDNRMRIVCLHEIGHALGLAGHTTNPDDIMFYSTSFKDEWRNLSGRDARTIQRLYGPN